MSNAVIRQDTRASLYWRWWLIVVAIAILLRLTVILFFGAAPNASIGMIYGAGTWIPLLLLNANDGRKLLSYLKEHHHQTWEKVTHTPLGPGGRNTFRYLSWLDSAEGMDDPVLAVMKTEQRKLIRLTLTVFCTYPIMWPLLSI